VGVVFVVLFDPLGTVLHLGLGQVTVITNFPIFFRLFLLSLPFLGFVAIIVVVS
jgi:hypothetical protein